MPGAGAAGSDPGGEVAAITARLDELTDLIRRRLSDDRDKRRVIEELASQVQFARAGLTQQILLPLVRELLLVVDRASSLDDVHASSVGAELLESLNRYGVEPLPVEGRFDPRIHEATRTLPCPDAAQVGQIAAVERDGYRLGDAVVRVAKVSVYTEGSLPAPPEAAAHADEAAG